MKITTTLLLLICFAVTLLAQGPAERQQFIRIDAPVIALVQCARDRRYRRRGTRESDDPDQ